MGESGDDRRARSETSVTTTNERTEAPGKVYEAPGRRGSLVSLKARYGNFIGGNFVPPVTGE